MSIATWGFPTKIIYGEDAIEGAGREARRLGGSRVLIVTDPGVVSAGVIDIIGKQLKDSELAYSVFDDVASNPSEEQVKKATEAYRSADSDIVIGVGGGSALDVAKLVGLSASHQQPLKEFDATQGGVEKIVNPLPPIIAIPTTAGTGSEVGRSAVVTLAAQNAKTVIFSPLLMPKVAVLDPKLTVSLPASVTASTGFDALTHNVEAYCARGLHPMADAIALGGIELIATHLKTAVEQPDDLTARGAMLQAAMMGAVAFQKGLGACHALAHPLSAEYNLHHGLANALCLPAVIDFNRQTIAERIARVARLLGARGEDTETLAFECSGAVRQLRQEVGLPDGLSQVGIEAENIEKLAALAFEDGSHRENPRNCTQEDLASLYTASL